MLPNNYQVILDGAVPRTMKYDLNGNLTNSTSASSTNIYEWDAADRLVRITQLPTNSPQLTSEFTYDGFGRRIQIIEKTNGGVQSENRCLWCGMDLCEERDSTGSSVNKRFFGQGEQIGGTSYYFTRDHMGSVREMMDSTSIIRARYDYDPYGRRTKLSGDLDADFGFTGHYFHAPTALSLTLYRAYDPTTGRWLSRDPLAEGGGPNLYTYCLGDPQNNTDPDGLFVVSLFFFLYDWQQYYQRPCGAGLAWNTLDVMALIADFL